MSHDPDAEAERWFYNLESMARRIEENEARHGVVRRRQYAVTGFMLFAFVVLAWRSEVNSGRIDRNTERIVQEQHSSCLRGREILVRFNAQQDALATLARRDGDRDAVSVYEGFRIDPLPTCES